MGVENSGTPPVVNTETPGVRELNAPLRDPIRMMEAGAQERERLAGQVGQIRREATERQGQRVGQAYEQFGQAQREASRPLDQMGPPPAFVPTKENAGDLATLFSLLAVAGTALGGKGKSGAMSAMSSMTGMLNGWRQGRQDLYERERKQFDASMQQFRAQQERLKGIYERAMQTAQTDLQRATQQAEIELKAAGADADAMMLRIQGLPTTYQVAQQKFQAAQRAEDRAFQIAQADRQRTFQAEQTKQQQAFQAEESRLQRESALAVAQARAGQRLIRSTDEEGNPVYRHGDGTIAQDDKGQPMRPPGGQADAVQRRYNNSLRAASQQLQLGLENITSMPVGSAPSVLGDYLAGKTDSLSRTAVRFLANRATQQEARAYDQLIAPVVREIARIQASGAPSGVTQASVEELRRAIPKPGDSMVNQLLFLAMAKQELRIVLEDLETGRGTPEQIQAVRNHISAVERVVPYEVRDVTRIIRGGRLPMSSSTINEAVQRADNLQQLNRERSAILRQRLQSGEQQADVTTQAAPADTSIPPPAERDIEYLRKNDSPAMRATFNRRFGQGAAERILGGGQ